MFQGGESIEVDWRNTLADEPVWVPVQFEGVATHPDWGFGVITGVPVPDAGAGWASQVGVRITFDVRGPYIRSGGTR